MIRVADGLYLPDSSGLPDPRDATFTITPGLTVSGGYAGCNAPDPDARDPRVHVTIMSGDMELNDPVNLEDNAYHVCTAAAMGTLSTLSGFSITGGNAGPGGQGGGILASGARLTLSLCDLVANRAWRGGAVYIEGGELHLFHCRVTDNHAVGEGGAVFDAMGTLEAYDCLFALNEAGNDGGAIFSDLCALRLMGCSFGANVSASRGGAVYEYVGVEATVGNSIFWGNTDMSGEGESSQIFVNPSNLLDIDYSCVQGWTGAFGGEGNTGEDPLCVDLPAGDMHLGPDSPCIDRGSNELVGTQLDLDGNPRILNGTVDMGCYEFPEPTGIPDAAAGGPAGRILRISSQPADGSISVRFLPPRQGKWALSIYDVRGRRLARLGRGDGGAKARDLIWRGWDAQGNRVPAGIFLVALEQRGRLLDAGKAIRLR